ncbi:MAG: RDD family protein [Lachnospiraceae bacterium]|nr:RDD family protein [Lachnospiraceae bacterium]
MTFRDISKELGIGTQTLAFLEKEGIIKGHGATALLGNFDESEVKAIRQYCLFAMLGVRDADSFSIIRGNADLKDTLKVKVNEILSDNSNHTQAAIVLQNIRRENAGIEELDPVPYLQHIKELKASGGIFYDVNTGRLGEDRPLANNRQKEKGGFLKGLLDARFINPKDHYTEGEPEKKDIDGKYTGEYKEVKKEDSENNKTVDDSIDSKSNKASQKVLPDRKTDLGETNTGETGAESTSEENAPTLDGSVSGKDAEERPGNDSPTDNADDRTASASDDEEERIRKANERWSPYTIPGLGASNMGEGNWHGWSPGYGTYTAKIGTRERINNGEKTCPYPVRRFIARIIDTTIITVIGNAILKIGFRANTGLSMTTLMYCEIIFWLFELMIEPLLLTTIGTTPGKWIMGIAVRDMKSKGKLELKQAYIRAVKLAWHGFGLMIPLFTIYKRFVSYMKCRMNDTMPWDEGIDVELTDDRQTRIVLCVIALIVLNVADELVAKQAMIPGNRGDITKDQFYENVAELMDYTGVKGDIPEYVVTTGSNGYVKSVSISYTDEQTENNRYNEIYLAFLAFAGAADGSNGINLMFTSTTGMIKAYYNSFEDNYCGIKIQNVSDSMIKDESSYSALYSMLYGTTTSVPAFNQTFTMTKE